MTDIPSAGIVVCAAKAYELSAAKRTAGEMADRIRAEGVPVKAYGEAILGTEDAADALRETLINMCAVCDLVVTVGGAGFHGSDIVPAVTDTVCTECAGCFAGVLCGAYPLPCADEDAPSFRDGNFCPAAERRKPFMARLRKMLYAPLFPRRGTRLAKDKSAASDDHRCQAPDDTDLFAGLVPPSRRGREAWREDIALSPPFSRRPLYIGELPRGTGNVCAVRASRASAGIRGKTLVMNFPAEPTEADRLLRALLPQMICAIWQLSGKDAGETERYDEFVNKYMKSADFLTKLPYVN